MKRGITPLVIVAALGILVIAGGIAAYSFRSRIPLLFPAPLSVAPTPVSPPSPTPTPAWQVYKNSDYGFEIAYPPGFQVAADKYGWPRAVLLLYQGGQSYDLALEIWDSVAQYKQKYPPPAANLTIKQVKNKYLTLLNANSDSQVDAIIATLKITSSPPPTPPAPAASPTPPATPAATPTPVSQSTTINSSAGLDGFRASNNGGNDSIEIRIGRNSNLTMRGFVSFSIPSAVAGKTIDSATLRLYQYQVVGTPYAVGGTVVVEHLDYGSSLDSADYAAGPFDSASSSLGGASNPTVEWKDIDVTSAFKNDLSAGHSRSQYRLKFTTETIGGDVTGDFAYFYSSNPGANTYPPQLAIKYH